MTLSRRHAPLPVVLAAALTGACGTQGGASTTTTALTASTTTTTSLAATPTSSSPAVPTTTTTPATPTAPTTTGASAVTGTSTTAAPTTATTPAPSRASARTGSRLPVYLVGRDGDAPTESGAATTRLRLFREFRPTPAGAASGTAADVAATRAVSLAMAGGAGYLAPWGESSVVSTRRSGGTITVTLSAPGPASADAETARLAVASLVWTATAAYGADVPVRFVVPGGRVIGSVPTSAPQRRAAGAAQADVLAGIWVDTPALDQQLPAGRITATGQAAVPEGTVRWRVTQGTRQVRQGVTTAAVAAPARGAWSADLGVLPAGSYVLTAWSDSPADAGGRLAQVTHPFRVD